MVVVLVEILENLLRRLLWWESVDRRTGCDEESIESEESEAGDGASSEVRDAMVSFVFWLDVSCGAEVAEICGDPVLWYAPLGLMALGVEKAGKVDCLRKVS